MSPFRSEIPVPAPESFRRAVVPFGVGLSVAYLGWVALGAHPYPPGAMVAILGVVGSMLLLVGRPTTWFALWRSAALGGVAIGLDVAITCAAVGVVGVQSQVVLALGVLVVFASRSRADVAPGLLIWLFVMLVGLPFGPTRGHQLGSYLGQLSATGLLLWYAAVAWHGMRSTWITAITLQKNVLAEQATLLDVVERTGILLARVDASGHPSSGEARWGLWLGLSVPSHHGTAPESLWGLYTQGSRSSLQSELIPEALERGISRGRLVLTEAAGGRELDATFVLLEDGALGTLQIDVTQHALAEAARDHFVNTVSHELRTPLTAVGSTLDLLDRGIGGELPAQAHGLIGIARSNTERLVRLINQLLDLQKLGTQRLTQQRRPARLEELVALAVEGIDATAVEAGVALSVEMASDLPRVNVDEDRIIQVVTNLLSNAIRHSPEGGAVTVNLRARGQGLVVCSVSDEGPGVPEEAAERIFEAFEQADAAGLQGGTGLGLAISRAIMNEHGGSLRLHRDGAPGAVFSLILPAEKGAIEQAEDLRPRVLMVEDEELVGRALARLLMHSGFRVDLVRRLDDARSFLVANRIDVLVVDLVLPDGLGHDLIDWLEVSHRQVPVVVMSGRRAQSDDSRVFEHLQKPFQASALVNAVRGAIRGDRAPAGAVVGPRGAARLRVEEALRTSGVVLRQPVASLAEVPLNSDVDLVVVVASSLLAEVVADLEPHRRGRLSAAAVLVLADEPTEVSHVGLRLGRGQVVGSGAPVTELVPVIQSLLDVGSP